jgi:shikimate kinase
MNITRVFLVGFMGAGKSTVGPLLAARLGWVFVDLDCVIENLTGSSIQRIFEVHGQDHFRDLETSALRTLQKQENCVIALGGGAFVQQNNRELVRKLGCSVFLDCPLDLVLARCPKDGTRPLLQDLSKVETLYRSRLPFYLTCDFRVNVADRTPEEICDLIIEQVSADPEPNLEAGLIL